MPSQNPMNVGKEANERNKESKRRRLSQRKFKKLSLILLLLY